MSERYTWQEAAEGCAFLYADEVDGLALGVTGAYLTLYRVSWEALGLEALEAYDLQSRTSRADSSTWRGLESITAGELFDVCKRFLADVRSGALEVPA